MKEETATSRRRVRQPAPDSKRAAELGAVLAAYQDGEELANEQLYEAVKRPFGFTDEDYERRDAIGGKMHCKAHRRVRFVQQTLKHLSMLERVPGKRGVWRMRGGSEKDLTPAGAGMTLVAFSTNLGISLWSSCDVLASINEPVALVLTSPPYPLTKPRAYGGPSESEVVDFLCRSLEPVVRNLLPGGSILLNISQDIFLQGTPARSLYVERLTLALHDRLGLGLMDRIIWRGCKPPGPVQWASKSRQQLNVDYEFCLWFSNDPLRCFADNRRVLLPHSEQHKKLMARGGERRDAIYGDGAYRLYAGRSFAKETPGRIPRNILEFTHHDAEIRQLRQQARLLGLPIHGALMPLALATFFVKFLTREEDLVMDLFSGWGTTGMAAEESGRRWIMTERIAEYVAAQAVRFRRCGGFRCYIPPSLLPMPAGG